MPDPNMPPIWVPNTDVFITPDGDLVIKVELAGLSKEDLEITVEGRRVTFSGSRPDPEPRRSNYLVREMGHGDFRSVLELPPGFDPLQGRANYEKGILRVVIPPESFHRRDPGA